MKKFFITGTGTDIGKTYVTKCLLNQYAKNYRVIGAKPIAAGLNDIGLNDDITELMKLQNMNLSYQQLNLYHFQQPISPHIGFMQAGLHFDVDKFIKYANELYGNNPDYIFFEGAGGILSPVDDNLSNLDLIKMLDIPIVIVVGIKLGCLNDAMLVSNILKQTKVKVRGWVANQINPDMLGFEENIEYLKKYMDFKFLGLYKFNSTSKIEL
jgi:dethiobiotin synthetase